MKRLQIRSHMRFKMPFRMGALALLSASLLCATHAAHAQGDGAPIAMGNGRMVQGTVTAAAADHVTVKTQQGDLYQISVSANTQVRRGRDAMKLADVHVGDGVGAVGEIDASTKTVHALFLAVVTAEDLQKAKDALGKTFIAGTVTAINDLKLSIKRSDGVEQVIQVDEDTSFRRGGRNMQQMMGGGVGGGRGGQRAEASQGAQPEGESITLADVKVGSLVAGPGGLKNGVFVPTQLGVSDPQARRQRRSQDGASNPGAAATPTTPPPTEVR